jgi:hypothetical protein
MVRNRSICFLDFTQKGVWECFKATAHDRGAERARQCYRRFLVEQSIRDNNPCK